MNESNPMALAVAGAQTQPPPQPQYRAVSLFNDTNSFAEGQRIARFLCSSNLVPEAYRGEQNMASAVIALDIARQRGLPPLTVMQNLNVVLGKPAWSSQMIISMMNTCGRFKGALKYKFAGSGDTRSCVAWAVDSETGEVLEGPSISIDMAKGEGWYARNGSKWKTMPDIMLQYRSATFFAKLYAPDVLMGYRVAEEIVDVEGIIVDQQTQAPAPAAPAVTEGGKRRPKLAKVVDIQPAEPAPAPAPVVAPPAPEPAPAPDLPDPPAPEPEPAQVHVHHALHTQIRALLTETGATWDQMAGIAHDQAWWPQTERALEALPLVTLNWIIKNARGIKTALAALKTPTPSHE